ncbi:MAG: hypothetical protein WBH44_01870, partial [Proteocatella sp.]
MNNIRAIELMLASNSSFFLMEADADEIYSDLKMILCEKFKLDDFENNVDVRVYDSSDLQLADIKKIVFEIGLKPFSEKKIILFKNFEKIGELSQNALLKSIEELPEDTVIISICNETIKILDTIKSRSYYIYLKNKNSKADFVEKKININGKSKQEMLKMFDSKQDREDLLKNLEEILISNNKTTQEALLNNECTTKLSHISSWISQC